MGQTIESFVKSLDGNIKEELDPDSDENQFVLALAGIVTSKLKMIVCVLFSV